MSNRWKTLYIGRKQEDLEGILKAKWKDIPFINNNAYKLDFKDLGVTYIIKTVEDLSILEILTSTDAKIEIENKDDGLNQLKQTIVYWEKFIKTDAVTSKNQAFKEFYDYFGKKEFTGVIVFNLTADISAEHIGRNILLKNADFYAPYTIIEGVNFTETTVVVSKAVTKSILSLYEPVLFKHTNSENIGLTLRRTDIYALQGNISYAGTVFRISFHSMFGSAISSNGYIEIYGLGLSSYDFPFGFLRSSNIFLYNSFIQSVEMQSADIKITSSLNITTFKLICAGKMILSKLSEEFDPFSYGNAATKEGLDFSTMEIRLSIKDQEVEGYEIIYKNITLPYRNSSPRIGSFANYFPFISLDFVSHEDYDTPKKMGFTQITTPVKQQELAEQWYGFSYKLEFATSVYIRIMFAFSAGESFTTEETAPKFYAGALVEAFGTPKRLSVTVGSLFRIGFQSIVLKTEPDGRYSILFKGLSVGMMGLSMPQSGCDIVMLGKENAWYACYEK